MKSATRGEIAKPQARTRARAKKAVAAPVADAAAPRAGSTQAAADAPQWNGMDVDQRQLMVAEAAYFRAERRGFMPGYELEDWLLAEAEVDRALIGDPASRA